MKVYGKVSAVDRYNRTISIAKHHQITHYHLTNKMMHDFKGYLQLNPYILFDTSSSRTIVNGKVVYEVNHFIKIMVPTIYGQTIFYNIEDIQSIIRELINKPHYRLFLDLEFSLPGNGGKPVSEIVQYGMVLEDPDGKLVFEEASLLKPFYDKALNARTLLFLSRVYSDFENAPTYIEFYQSLERCIRDYDAKIIAWGKNDILAMQKSFKTNHLRPLDLRNRYINLMQVMKNYYSYKQEKGLFTTYQEMKQIPSTIQNHDALEDAKIAREIFHMFQDEINK
jgi:sporulation inhibitor KapD